MADISVTAEGIEVAGELLLTWEEVDAQRNRFRFANNVLVKVGFSYGRVSDILDQEIYDRDQWIKIKAALTGLTAYFSDFAGKHSQVDITFWDQLDVEEIYNVEEISEFHSLHGISNNDLSIVEEAIHQNIENGYLNESYAWSRSHRLNMGS